MVNQKRGFKGVTLLLLRYTLCSARAEAEMQQQYLYYLLLVIVPTQSIVCTERQFLFQSIRNQSRQNIEKGWGFLSPQMYSVEDLRPREAK